MTKYILIILSAFIIFGATAQKAVYSTNYNSVVSKAKKNGKYILVYFSESKNDNRSSIINEPLLADKKLISLAISKYNVVFIDKNNAKYSSLTKKYSINYIPTYLFIDYNQVLVHKRIGILSNEEASDLLEKVSKNKNTLRFFKEVEKKNPQKLHNLDYANALYEAGMDYDKYITDYFASINESTYDQSYNMNAFYRYSNNIYSPEFMFFALNKEYLEDGISFSKQEYKYRIEDVITNHILDAIEEDDMISIEDTLISIRNYFEIGDIQSLESNVLVKYNERINMDSSQYISILPIYINTHKDVITNEELAKYCNSLIVSDDMEVLESAHNWMKEVLGEHSTISNYYIDFQLLINMGKHNDAQRVFNGAKSSFKEKFTKEWRTKFENRLNYNANIKPFNNR